MGAVNVPRPQHGAFTVAELVEDEEGVVANTAKMTVVIHYLIKV